MAGLIVSRFEGPPAFTHPRRTLGDLLRENAARWPDHPALRGDRAWDANRSQLTYAELLEQSELCAHRLLTLFEPGERVAVWAESRPEWVVLQFGAALAGMILVTVNPAFKADEARYVLEQSGASGCFASVDYRGVKLAGIARELEAELPMLRSVCDLDALGDFLGGYRQEAALPAVAPGDPVMIQYTSGTTGFPKGALLIHERLVDNATHVALRGDVPERCVWLLPIPLFHAGGCVMGLLGAMSKGGTIVLMSSWSADEALRLIEEHRVDVLSAVPTMLFGLIEQEKVADRDLGSLKRVIAGAGTVPASLIRDMKERLGVEVSIVFGQTECGPVATMTHVGDSFQDKQDTIGTPMPGFEIKITDPETNAILPPGRLGEFVARGNTMVRYWQNEAATTAAFDDEGWLHTGDLCSMDDRGYLRVEGRLRDMIIRGGENIYPREIEDLLVSQPSVREVAIVGLPDLVWGEVLAAFVVPAGGAGIDTAGLSDLIRHRLARFKVPEHWFVVDELPRTNTGKVQKYVLREQWRAGLYAAPPAIQDRQEA
jgi:fatty-acyl-CoA synthase